MQIVPVSTSQPSPRPSGGRAGVGAVEPVTELLRGAPSGRSAERVLQGEFLERGREPEPGPADGEPLMRQRREDHPAFHPQHDNRSYIQRRAVAAYQAQAATADERRGGTALDCFI